MAENKTVKTFESDDLSGKITIVDNEAVIEFEYIERKWGLVFFLIPWLKKYRVKRIVVRSRNNANFRDFDRYTRYGEMDPVLINVLNQLVIEAYEEHDLSYPTPESDVEIELSDDETNVLIDHLNPLSSNVPELDIHATLEECEALIGCDSEDDVITEVLAETDAEIARDAADDLSNRNHGYGGYVSPSPSIIEPSHTDDSSHRSPSPSYDSSPSYSSPSPSYSSPSPSYDSGSSSSSGSFD